jgi:hypothetical protein
MPTITGAQPALNAAPKASSKDVADKYRAIEAAVQAGKDEVTIGSGADTLPIHILATGGKHAAFHAKSPDDVRFKTIVAEEGGYPGKSYMVTYQLSSADGVDNMLRVTSVEENPDWGSNQPSAPATTQTIFGAFW